MFQISFAANSPVSTAQTKRLFAMTQRFSFLLVLFELFAVWANRMSRILICGNNWVYLSCRLMR